MKKSKFKKYKFKGRVWKFKGPAAWHFVTLSKILSRKIRQNHGVSEEGWGRLKATSQIGRTRWQTAIWFDTKIGSYILPIKRSVRQTEDIRDRSLVAITLCLEADDSVDALVQR